MLSIFINAEWHTPNGIMHSAFGKTHFIEFQLVENKSSQPLYLCDANCHAPLTEKSTTGCSCNRLSINWLHYSVLNYMSNKLPMNVYCWNLSSLDLSLKELYRTRADNDIRFDPHTLRKPISIGLAQATCVFVQDRGSADRRSTSRRSARYKSANRFAVSPLTEN